MAQSNNISIFVSSQVPDFWNRDAGEFVNFIKLYYEWAEQFENPIVISRKLTEYKDVDLIPEKYFQFMRNEFMKNIPVTKVNDRLLMKNIVDFYRARGTEKAYRMLFRILYGDENVSFYYPGKDILRASDGKWVIERSLKLNLIADPNLLENVVVVRGETSRATARKDKFLAYVINEVKTDELYVNNLFGEFLVGEFVLDDNTGEKLGTIDAFTTYPGGWVGTDGFLSSDKKLEDNFFYQEYSYQIRSSHALAEYENIANALAHPAGTKLFGAVDILEIADFSSLTLSLISNLGNVGDVSKISIPYEIILPEQPHLGAVSNTAPRFWVTQAGTQDVQIHDTIGFWGNSLAFQSFGDMSFADFSKPIVFHSDVPSFGMTAWTPIKIIDATHSANTYAFAQVVVNNTVLVLSTQYTYGVTTGLHYQITTSSSLVTITEGNDTLSSASKLAIKGTSSVTESGDTVSSATKLALKATSSVTESGDTLSSASSLAAASDPFFSNVVLLAGLNGTNGATTTTDDSLSAHTSTFNGSAVLDTSQSKFGTSSLRVPNGGNLQYSTGQSDWGWLTGQFTIEGFFRWNTVSGTPCLIGQMGVDRWMVYYNGSSLIYRDGNANFSGSNPWTPTTGTWYHIAVDRDATASQFLRIYVDGGMQSKITFNINQPAGSDPLTIGQRFAGSSTYNFDGWVDEVRITKGVARYASDGGFTVPTTEYPRS